MNHVECIFSVVSVYSPNIHKPGWRFDPKNDGWDLACVITIEDGKADHHKLFERNVRPITLVPSELEGQLSLYLNKLNTKGWTFKEMSEVVYDWIAQHWPYAKISDRK